MSDASWIKIKSALPRPTSEQHSRPLRLFAPGYATDPRCSDVGPYGLPCELEPGHVGSHMASTTFRAELLGDRKTRR